jgi:hypothetical protein
MAGNQFGFNYRSDFDIKCLYQQVKFRLDDYFSHYHLTNNDILYVQLSFRMMDIKFFSKFKIDKPIYVSHTDHNKLNKMISIPVSVNENYLGKPLNITIKDNYNVKM